MTVDLSKIKANRLQIDDVASEILKDTTVKETLSTKASINDESTSSTTETWSANKLNDMLGDIEALLRNINSGD